VTNHSSDAVYWHTREIKNVQTMNKQCSTLASNKASSVR